MAQIENEERYMAAKVILNDLKSAVYAYERVPYLTEDFFEKSTVVKSKEDANKLRESLIPTIKELTNDLITLYIDNN